VAMSWTGHRIHSESISNSHPSFGSSTSQRHHRRARESLIAAKSFLHFERQQKLFELMLMKTILNYFIAIAKWYCHCPTGWLSLAHSSRLTAYGFRPCRMAISIFCAFSVLLLLH